MNVDEPHRAIAQQLAAARGVVSVALGGSRSQGTARSDSDWDLGVFYRGEPDLSVLEQYGTVYPPGSWGRIMNGGAWLTIAGAHVDVLLRDLEVVEHWSQRAEEGDFEIDALLGYIAGAPTYSLLAERALSVPLHGPWPAKISYPEKAHARLCEQERWVMNEKNIVQVAGLEPIQAHFQAAPNQPSRLLGWVEQLRTRLESAPEFA